MADAGHVAANALLHGNTSHAARIANATLHCNASHAVQLITPLHNKAGQAVTIPLPQGILLLTFPTVFVSHALTMALLLP